MPFRERAAFVLMCLIWGSTWIAIDVGLAAVPPLFFAGTRFFAAGAILLAALAMRGRPLAIVRAHWARTALATLLLVTATYAALFWGMLFVSSGLAAVLNLTILPVALLGFAVASGEERLAPRKLAAIALGMAGLLLLFGPAVFAPAQGEGFLGAAAIVLSTLAYAAGSVIARPLLRSFPPMQLAGTTALAGGALLIVLSLLFEPGAMAALSLSWGLTAWAGWAFLVLAGSLLAYTIFLRLVRDWGASRAGSFAFVSPVIAVLLGALLRGEHISFREAAAMILMLAATFLALAPPHRGAEPGHDRSLPRAPLPRAPGLARAPKQSPP